MDKRPAIFLDRDGTLNRDPGFVHRLADLELLDNVVAGLKRFQSLGFLLVIVTNQSGIARGYFNEEQMHAFNRGLCERLAKSGVRIAAVYHCPFHPDGVGEFASESPLRKPAPGMLELAASEHEIDLAASFAIGDKRADVEAGRAAGCRTIWLRTDGTADPLADYVARDMLDAAAFVERTLWSMACGRIVA